LLYVQDDALVEVFVQFGRATECAPAGGTRTACATAGEEGGHDGVRGWCFPGATVRCGSLYTVICHEVALEDVGSVEALLR